MMLEQYMGAFLYGMMTNSPIQFILCALLIGLSVQMIISFVVMLQRKDVLKDEYEFTDVQIRGFFWKSVVLFPVTWYLLFSQGAKSLFNRIRRNL
jgi:hypothetical protein